MQIIVTPQGKHKLPPLPYAYDALEPIISERTLQIHHDIHHKAYVDGLNKTEIKLVEARNNNDYENIKCLENELAFNGSGHILHSIYWTVMSPLGTGGQPGKISTDQIIYSFGSLSAFKEQFLSAGEKVEGSGWVILAYQPAFGHIVILQSEKHQNLTLWGAIPLLVMDVWEHAYYLDYQNKRREYAEKWWNLIRWNEVERRLWLAAKEEIPLTLNENNAPKSREGRD